MRLPSILLIASMGLARPEQALALGAVAPSVVRIQYTADVGGIHRTAHSIRELEGMFEAQGEQAPRVGQVAFDHHVLVRGPWSLWRDGEALPTVDEARAWFSGSGLRVKGAVPLRVLRSQSNTLTEWPEGREPWALAWLWADHERTHRSPSLRTHEGRLFRMEGASGQPLWLLSADGSQPDPSGLRDPLAWRWAMRGRFPIRLGDRVATVVGVADGYGGGAVRALADRLHQPGGLRVDLGNALGRAGALEGPEGRREALAHLGGLGLDALVPGEEELRLTPEDWARLGAQAPLLACNLKPLAGQAPTLSHRLCRVGQTTVALVGLADAEGLRRRALVGGRGAWQALDSATALREACEAARKGGADAILVLTNLKAEGWWALQAHVPGVVAVLTADALHPEADFQERIAPEGASGRAVERPWLVAGVSQYGLGELAIELAPARHRPGLVPVAVSNRNRLALEAESPLPERSWRGQALRQTAVALASEDALPDAREVLGEGVAQYQWRHQGQLGANLLREAMGAELAVLPGELAGFNTVGRVSERVVGAWYGHEHPVGSLVLTGAQLRSWLAQLPKGGQVILAGVDPLGRQVGGRALDPTEAYRIATTEDLAGGEALAQALGPKPPTPFQRAGGPQGGLLLRDVVTDGLRRLRQRLGWGPALNLSLRRLVGEEAEAVAPRWQVGLRSVEGNFQQLRVGNRAPFSAVRNAAINLPDNAVLGAKGQAFANLESAPLDWMNQLRFGYQRMDLLGGPEGSFQEQSDAWSLASELRFNSWSWLARTDTAPEKAWVLVPYLASAYQSEFTPTVNPDTQSNNPLRRELNGSAGLVFKPGGWLRELRVGALLEQDFAVLRGGTEPGLQLGALVQQDWGNATLRVEADLKHFVGTAEDTPDDLGTLASLDAGLSCPIWGPLAFRLGLQALAFTGKVPSTMSWGTSLTPSVGLSLNGTWKPLSGVAY